MSARQQAGLKELHLLRNADDPNEVILLFEAEDLQRAKDFTAAPDLRERMQAAGVTERPDKNAFRWLKLTGCFD